ncbi:hypothetical protein P167DRAFT_593404, partial [Morchella conica CCBAS932]
MSFQPHLNPYYGRIPPADTTYPPQLPFMPTLDPSTAQLTLHTPFPPHTLITLTPLPPHTPPLPPPSAPPSPHPHPPRPRNPPSTTSLFITHRLTRTVAVALDPTRPPTDPARYVLKCYYTTPHALWRREHELDAYTHLACLQGGELPWCYGEYAASGMPREACSVLVLEMVLPGTTISDVMAEVIALPIAVGDTVEDRQMRWERARARLRLMGLHGSAVRAVDRVGACGAGHNGVGGGKMV